MPGILIEHGTLLSHDGRELVETSGWLAIDGDRIAAVGSGEAPATWHTHVGRVIDARHMAVLPGLVNGHTHLSQTFLRGLDDGRPLLRWLKEVIWPAQAAMTPEDLYLAATLGLVENLRCGATTVVQHHKLPGKEHLEAVAGAAARVGMRLLLARGWVDLGASGEPLDRILDEASWLYETWHGENSDRIRVALGPLAPWRCSDDATRETVALARRWGLATHIHVAEAQDEIAMMLERCGRRHVEWLADLGLLGPDMHLVHAIHVTDAELDLIAEAGAMVVYCPTSNMYLASGAAPVHKMLYPPSGQRPRIPVALGTDGSGSSNSQDVLECARIAALLAKHAAGDAQALQAADVIRMLTVDGARLWDAGRGARDGERKPEGNRRRTAGGELVVGGRADVTIIDLDTPRCQPVHRVASALVYNASGPDVHTVIVDGRVLLDAGRPTMLDEDVLMEECRWAARALLRRAGIGQARPRQKAS